MEEKIITIDKKVYAYNITSEQDLNLIFLNIKDKISDNYENLESRNLVYTSIKDGYKYFLDVKNIKDCNKVDESGTIKIFECILYKLRETDFPYLFDLATGEKSNIESTDTEALMEQTHFLVIPEVNLILSEYNHFGAQVNKLIFLINKILGPLYSNGFEVKHLLNSKTAIKVNNLEILNEFRFKAGHQGLRTISNYFKVDAIDVLDKCFDNSTDLELEIIIKGKGQGKNKKNIEIKDMGLFKRLCNLIYNSKNKKTLDIKTAQIKDAEMQSKLPIDLFSEYLAVCDKIDELKTA